MTAPALVAELEARGVTLCERDGRLIIRPSKAVTVEETAQLRQAKAEVLALLRGRSLGVDWSRISLYQLDTVVEVVVPWADASIILAPGCRIARAIRSTDPQPGRVWCTCEVLDLLLTNVPGADTRRVGAAKVALQGMVVGVKDLR